MKALLSELVDLLSTGNVDADERSAIVQQIEASPKEFDWASSAAQAYSIALTTEMHLHSASGDKYDEVHDEMREMLGDEFPAYPQNLKHKLEYFIWMDHHLSEWTTDGGYDLVEIDDMATDNMHLFVVYRRDVGRILEIASSIGLRANRPLDYWTKLSAA